jgi:poly(hydroxyalkanoate) granule-associated protein
MARKKQTRKTARGTPASTQMRLLNAMNEVWLAGLGAVAKAQRGAPKLFDDLVVEGARFQTDTRGAAEESFRNLVDGVQSRISAGIGQARSQASDALENLEKIFQTRVHRALTQLGVPSADQVDALSKRVDVLNANIDKLARKGTGNGKPRGRKAGSVSAARL